MFGKLKPPSTVVVHDLSLLEILYVCRKVKRSLEHSKDASGGRYTEAMIILSDEIEIMIASQDLNY